MGTRSMPFQCSGDFRCGLQGSKVMTTESPSTEPSTELGNELGNEPSTELGNELGNEPSNEPTVDTTSLNKAAGIPAGMDAKDTAVMAEPSPLIPAATVILVRDGETDSKP